MSTGVGVFHGEQRAGSFPVGEAIASFGPYP